MRLCADRQYCIFILRQRSMRLSVHNQLLQPAPSLAHLHQPERALWLLRTRLDCTSDPLMHWSTALYKAAEAFDGGARSFPLASEAGFACTHGYEPPNRDYEMLFSRCASASRSQREQGASPHSA